MEWRPSKLRWKPSAAGESAGTWYARGSARRQGPEAKKTKREHESAARPNRSGNETTDWEIGATKEPAAGNTKPMRGPGKIRHAQELLCARTNRWKQAALLHDKSYEQSGNQDKQQL
jgi:hypothetical protein